MCRHCGYMDLHVVSIFGLKLPILGKNLTFLESLLALNCVRHCECFPWTLLCMLESASSSLSSVTTAASGTEDSFTTGVLPEWQAIIRWQQFVCVNVRYWCCEASGAQRYRALVYFHEQTMTLPSPCTSDTWVGEHHCAQSSTALLYCDTTVVRAAMLRNAPTAQVITLAFSKECPKWIFEKNMQRIKAEKNIHLLKLTRLPQLRTRADDLTTPAL